MNRRWLGSLVVVGVAVIVGCAPSPEVPTAPFGDTVRVRGHRDLHVGADGFVRARVTGAPRPIGLCFDVASVVDTTAWGMALRFGEVDVEVTTTVRSAGVYCGLAEPPATWSGSARLCGRVRDTVDDVSWDLPCADVEVDADASTYDALRQRRGEVLSSDLDLDGLIVALDELAAEATAAGYPAFGLQVRWIGAHYLAVDGSASAVDRAAEILSEEPSWLEVPEAAAWAGLVAQQRALLEVDRGRLSAAWRHLGDSEMRYAVLGIPRLAAVKERALLLADAGAVAEARQRLATALDDCAEQSEAFGRSVCVAGLTAAAHGDLAWLTLLDTRADAEAIEDAAELLVAAAEAADDPLEAANRRADLALARLRQGRSAEAELTEAKRLLDGVPAGERRRMLDGWLAVVSGLAALDRGETSRAVDYCASAVVQAVPRLRPWGASCVGRARRADGALDAAARSFDDALLRHELDRRSAAGQRVPLGVDQRADDFARAARLAVERGRPAEAWDLLERLDHLTDAERDRRRCPESDGEHARLDALLVELDALDGPASAARRAERQTQVRDLAARVRSLWRSRSGCSTAGADEPRPEATGQPEGTRVRAVALPDEIVALTSDGEAVRVERRPIDRDALRTLLAEFAAGRLDVESWRREAAPLAEVLTAGLTDTVDGAADEGAAEVLFSLHGVLQDVPLIALPWQDGWLGASWVPSVRPADGDSVVARRHDGERTAGVAPLVVVDPTRDLPAAAAAVEDWRRDFPTARLLRGDAASRDAVLDGLLAAEWLHIDAHGTFDAAFPELSGLRLSDRPLRVVELTDARATLDAELAFVHLSGCQTGQWPITADSGAYGLAGLFSRAGVPWVVASRYDLPDDLAAAFNRRFYAVVAGGGSVPEAFRQGVASLVDGQPPSAWGGLVLLRTDGEPGRSVAGSGQSDGRRTPPQGATPNSRPSSAEETL